MSRIASLGLLSLMLPGMALAQEAPAPVAPLAPPTVVIAPAPVQPSQLPAEVAVPVPSPTTVMVVAPVPQVVAPVAPVAVPAVSAPVAPAPALEYSDEAIEYPRTFGFGMAAGPVSGLGPTLNWRNNGRQLSFTITPLLLDGEWAYSLSARASSVMRSRGSWNFYGVAGVGLWGSDDAAVVFPGAGVGVEFHRENGPTLFLDCMLTGIVPTSRYSPAELVALVPMPNAGLTWWF